MWNEATSFLAFQYLSFHFIIKQGLLNSFPNFFHFVSFTQNVFKLGTPSQNCNFGRLHRNFLRDIFYLTIQHSIEYEYKSASKHLYMFSFSALFYLRQICFLFILIWLNETFLHYRIYGKGNDWILSQVLLQFFNSVFLKVTLISNGSLFIRNPCFEKLNFLYSI